MKVSCAYLFLLGFTGGFLILDVPFALAFNPGDQVQTTGTFNVRQTPAGTILGTQATGSLGTVTGGPTVATLSGTTYNWYDVNFTSGVDGWVADTGLIAATPTPTNWAGGLDVYSGNSAINWAQVAATGKTFAFAKSTEGATYTDSRFATYMPAGKAAGLLMGAYHFAHPLNNPGTNGAIAEAQHFLSVARAYVTNGWLPPVLDVEDEPNGTDPNDPCSDGTDSAGTSLNLVCKLGKAGLSSWVRAWVNEVKRQTHVTPMLYMNRSTATNGMEDDLGACPLWLAYFRTPPDVTPYSLGPWTNSWTFLQYSFTNTISGVSQPTVDFILFSGDQRALNLFTKQVGTTNILPPIISGVGGGAVQPPKAGSFQFEISSPTQTQVTVQAATNVTAWTNFLNVTISHGHGTFTDATSGGLGNRFYRVKQ